MPQVLLSSSGDAPRQSALSEILPAGVQLTDLALETRVPGFHLQDYESAAGSMPAAEFLAHMVGVWKQPRQSAGDGCAISWQEGRVTRTHAAARGTGFVVTAGPVGPLSWSGSLRMATFSVSSVGMEQVMPEPFTGHPIELRSMRAGLCDPMLNHLLDCIEAEAVAGYGNGRLFMEHLCHAAALHMAHRLGVRHMHVPAASGGLSRERLSRVVAYIDAYCASDLSVTTLAGIACLSPYHFGKMFRRSTGMTVHAYVTRERIVRVERLLRKTTMPLAQIATVCGFYDQSQMTHAFRRHYRLPPGAYRRLVC